MSSLVSQDYRLGNGLETIEIRIIGGENKRTLIANI
jgi:hypothetical protein